MKPAIESRLKKIIKNVPEIKRHRLFIVGDSRDGKKFIGRRLLENHNIILVSWMDGVMKYEVFLQERECRKIILEIRNYDLTTEKSIEFDDERDDTFFCYAIDDPSSFEHIVGSCINLLKEHFSDTTAMVYMDQQPISR